MWCFYRQVRFRGETVRAEDEKLIVLKMVNRYTNITIGLCAYLSNHSNDSATLASTSNTLNARNIISIRSWLIPKPHGQLESNNTVTIFAPKQQAFTR